MASAQAVLDWGLSQVGTKESPPDSNHVVYWDQYHEKTGANYQGEPWCAAFTALAYDIAGIWQMRSDEARFRYCPAIVSWAKEQGVWRTREQGGSPGALVIFANKGLASHVGIVLESLGAGKYRTIEGNTSLTSDDNGGAVMLRTRELGEEGSKFYILGFVEPEFAENQKRKARPMEFLIQPDGIARMDYVCGDSIHPLSHPDEMTAIQEVYRKCYGEEIPCFAYGTPDAPWATRLYDALKRRG